MPGKGRIRMKLIQVDSAIRKAPHLHFRPVFRPPVGYLRDGA